MKSTPCNSCAADLFECLFNAPPQLLDGCWGSLLVHLCLNIAPIAKSLEVSDLASEGAIRLHVQDPPHDLGTAPEDGCELQHAYALGRHPGCTKHV